MSVSISVSAAVFVPVDGAMNGGWQRRPMLQGGVCLGSVSLADKLLPLPQVTPPLLLLLCALLAQLLLVLLPLLR